MSEDRPPIDLDAEQVFRPEVLAGHSGVPRLDLSNQVLSGGEALEHFFHKQAECLSLRKEIARLRSDSWVEAVVLKIAALVAERPQNLNNRTLLEEIIKAYRDGEPWTK